MEEQVVCECGTQAFHVWLDQQRAELYLLCAVCGEPIVVSAVSFASPENPAGGWG